MAETKPAPWMKLRGMRLPNYRICIFPRLLPRRDALKRWEKKSIHRLFGDITDFDIQERANLKSAKLVISTVPDVDDNLLLLRMLHHENSRAKILTMALEVHDAKALYKAGADYVIMPHLTSGRQIAKLIKEDGVSSIAQAKNRDLKYINQ